MLQKTAEQCLIVINSKNKYEGTITDGDIRRYILNGNNLDDSIMESRLESQVMAGVTFRANPKKKVKEQSLVHLVEGNSNVISQVIELNFK